MNIGLKVGLGLIGGYLLAYGVKAVTVNLKHFSPGEFGIWWPLMDTELLLGLDQLRETLGKPVIISPAHGSLGRDNSETDGSYHNILKHGQVKAADIMFPWLTSKDELKQVFQLAAMIPIFGGVGAYPDWSPYPGLHVDTRPRKANGLIASWSGFRNQETGSNDYYEVARAFA